MRAVGLSDLDVATRAVLAVPPKDWAATAARLMDDAHVADQWRKRLGTAHPNGGTGSLYAQAALRAVVSSSDCTGPYCAALSEVIGALQAWRNRMELPKDHET